MVALASVPSRSIHAVVTHHQPHIDELVAFVLLRAFGEDQFPGISSANLVFWDPGRQTPDGRTADEWERSGFLLLGVGGGWADEHPVGGDNRKEGECAATLVAKRLRLEDHPGLKQLLRWVMVDDTKGARHPFDLASMLEAQYRTDDDPQRAVDWFLQAMNAYVERQVRYWSTAKEEFGERATIATVGTLRIAAIDSDEPDVAGYARNHHGGNADIAIVRDGRGNVSILTRGLGDGRRINIQEVVRMIRVEELHRAGLAIPRWVDLELPGSIDTVPHWFYQEDAEHCFNGGRRAKNVPATTIPLARILEIVSQAFDRNAFEPSRVDGCRAGTCGSSASDPCDWYDFGLRRCRALRARRRTARPPRGQE